MSPEFWGQHLCDTLPKPETFIKFERPEAPEPEAFNKSTSKFCVSPEFWGQMFCDTVEIVKSIFKILRDTVATHQIEWFRV